MIINNLLRPDGLRSRARRSRRSSRGQARSSSHSGGARLLRLRARARIRFAWSAWTERKGARSSRMAHRTVSGLLTSHPSSTKGDSLKRERPEKLWVPRLTATHRLKRLFALCKILHLLPACASVGAMWALRVI